MDLKGFTTNTTNLKPKTNYNMAQALYVLLMLSSLLLSAHDHGKPKEGNHNFWYSLIALIITTSLLYWGGFFDKL